MTNTTKKTNVKKTVSKNVVVTMPKVKSEKSIKTDKPVKTEKVTKKSSVEQVTTKKLSVGKAVNELFEKNGVDSVSWTDFQNLAKKLSPESNAASSEFSARNQLAWYKSKFRVAKLQEKNLKKINKAK